MAEGRQEKERELAITKRLLRMRITTIAARGEFYEEGENDEDSEQEIGDEV